MDGLSERLMVAGSGNWLGSLRAYATDPMWERSWVESKESSSVTLSESLRVVSKDHLSENSKVARKDKWSERVKVV